MRIVCWQTILMKYHTLFLSKIREEVTIFVVCCSGAGTSGKENKYKVHTEIIDCNIPTPSSEVYFIN